MGAECCSNQNLQKETGQGAGIISTPGNPSYDSSQKDMIDLKNNPLLERCIELAQSIKSSNKIYKNPGLSKSADPPLFHPLSPPASCDSNIVKLPLTKVLSEGGQQAQTYHVNKVVEFKTHSSKSTGRTNVSNKDGGEPVAQKEGIPDHNFGRDQQLIILNDFSIAEDGNKIAVGKQAIGK